MNETTNSIKSKQRILGSNAQYAKLPFSSFLAVQQELGIKQIDFCLQVPHLWCDQTVWESTEHIREQLKAADLAVPLVTPRAYKYSLCARRDTPQGNATRSYYANCLEVAGALGASQVVISAEGACWDVERDTLLKTAEEVLRELAAQAQQRGLTLLLTSVLGEESPLRAQAPVLNQLPEIQEMVGRVDSPALKVMLDVNVASVMGETITQWFAAFGAEIQAVRFTDGNYNGYRAWGEGCFPGDRFAEELTDCGYEGPLSLYLAGERYFDDPAAADRKNVAAVRRFLEEEGK